MRYTVYSKSARQPILLLLLFLTACSTGGYNSSSTQENLPDPQDKTAWNARFPSQSYITGWGVSTQSMQMAEQNAKATVAASVRSSIQSEMTSVMESESSDGTIRDYQKLESITKTRTHFDHAELIRLVPPTAHHHKGEFWVMAILSRREAVEELLIPYNAEATSFRFLATRLDSLKKDPPAFTTTWNDLNIQHRKMVLPAAEVRAVAGGKLPEISRDEKLFQKAETSRIFLLSQLEVVVILDDHPELNHDELVSKISTALTSLGLSVVGNNCRPEALSLKMTPQLNWTNVMGPVVQLELIGEVGLCGQAGPWNLFRLNDRHMRGEGRRPMEDLYTRLDPNFFEEYYYNLLKSYLPF